MRNTTMKRRTILHGAIHGAAIGVGLPSLEAMFNANGTAHADGTGLPNRFGIWFFGNGIRRQHWIPTETGTAWTPGEELQPLVDAGLKNDFSIISGLEIKTKRHPHHSGMVGITTGGPMQVIGPVRDTIQSTVAYPTLDVFVRKAYEAKGWKTPFGSLEVGVCRFTGTDEGTTFEHLSLNGPNNPNPSERNPSKVFQRLFGMAPNDPRLGNRLKARASVLDAVAGQIRALQATVGATDRGRLDGHMESVRALETRLVAQAATAGKTGVAGPGCVLPKDPGNPANIMGREPIAEKNKAISDLTAIALACDLTRVFTVNFETCGSSVNFWMIGATEGMHTMNHNRKNDLVHSAVVFTMEQCAYFLKRLKDTPEAAGNLLDSASILVTSEHSEGDVHSQDDFPILIAGKGGGRLKTGIHHRSRTKENVSHALLTLLRGAGLPLAEYGYELGKVAVGVPPLEA